MRAPAPLLFALCVCVPLLLGAPQRPSAGASGGAALLVLRSACHLPPSSSPSPSPSRKSQTVLGYEETCGAGWRDTVTRAALGALGGGDALCVVGWPGAAVCGALDAAAFALGRASPAVCALLVARAHAVALVAVRLGWESARLAAAAPASECAPALREVARALSARGVTPAPSSEPTPEGIQGSVVIVCASRELGVDGDALAAVQGTSSGTGASRTLLLHVDEPADPGAVVTGPEAVGRRGTERQFEYLLGLVDTRLPRGNLLLLTDESLDLNADFDRMYAEASEEITRISAAEATGTDVVDIPFHLYERFHYEMPVASMTWRRIATISTASSRLLDRTAARVTEARLVNVTDSLERWSAVPHSVLGASAGVGGAAALGAAVAAIMLCGLALIALAVRRGNVAQAGRGIDAVLLAPSEFSFPADERRRVGDGMETMLSCWLRRLHEFGGPELERPELLEPAPPPRAPSLPSSTCSVNRLLADQRTRYKGDPVHVKYPQAAGAIELKRRAVEVLVLMQSLRHENLNPFIGWLGAPGAPVWVHASRGSLEDVLMADDIKLDWTFRLSLLTDLVKGMRYLHASPLRVHGRLSSRNCVVDSRWVLRLTDYGQPAFHSAQPGTPRVAAARELLWTAPELLRDEAARARGSQPGDVFSFAIIMQEVIVRGEPYCMLSHTPEDLVEKLSRPPPLIRPSVSMGAAPPEAVSVMRQCWSEAPELRPDFHRLHDIFRRLHRGRKINIVDSMFEMLEKYSNNLEELIRDRTEQLDMEKKKTEQLLNRMLPRSVAERLLAGERVEPEEFAEVSIYFSDIVGFTELAARSSPVQVVDLLNDLYTSFDAAIERYRVYKVETIGDAYMVVGGLPARSADHAESVATMALHLLHLAGRFRVRHLPETPLRLRIGLHSGPVCAAVVGLTMPRYCLFGDTVNTASRMESTGAPSRVQVSAATATRLSAAGGFRLRSRGLVHVKGKGAMHTYWLLGKEGFDKALPTPPPLGSEEVLLETEGENDSEASSSGDVSASNMGRRRSGAVSADSSPPPTAPAPSRSLSSAVSASLDRDHRSHARYRRLGGGRALRRQWSLERGDSLAEAAAAAAVTAEPLALLAAAGAPSSRPLPAERYRTREEP